MSFSIIRFNCATTSPTHRIGGCVIFEQINAVADADAEYERWYNDYYLPAAVRRPGVRSGGLYKYRPGNQMLSSKPKHIYVGIYRTADASALAGWRASADLGGTRLIDPTTLSITHWEAVNARLTKDDALHPTAAFLTKEEAARTRIGEDLYKSPFDAAGAWEKAAVASAQRPA